MIPSRTPILGILHDVDAPHQNMVVVVTGKPNRLRWGYIVPRRYVPAGHHVYHDPELFTPLSDFGIHATMMPDGRLSLHQVVAKPALYPDGKPRHWQGAVKSVVDIVPRFAGDVVKAVALDFESRRTKNQSVT